MRFPVQHARILFLFYYDYSFLSNMVIYLLLKINNSQRVSDTQKFDNSRQWEYIKFVNFFNYWPTYIYEVQSMASSWENE